MQAYSEGFKEREGNKTQGAARRPGKAMVYGMVSEMVPVIVSGIISDIA